MDPIASIDFSINSTCVGILSSDGYSWYHFGREKTSYFDIGTDRFNRILFPKRTKGTDYCSTERQKMLDSNSLCSSILDVLRLNQISAVAFEGHAFNSKGNSLLDLVAYQFLLRNMIKNSLNIPMEMMFFYPPITVKSFAGGAKFKKKDMLMKFLEVEDSNIRENPVFLRISSSLDGVIKGDEVVKPVDDLVDSYWILKKLQQDV